MRGGTPPSTAPFDVFFVRGDAWLAIWFDLRHGKAEVVRKQVRRDFPDARWVPEARTWFLGKGSNYATLSSWRALLNVTLVSKTREELAERRMWQMDGADDAAELVYEVYKLGITHGAAGGERLHLEWDCARSWDSMGDRSSTEPVDKDFFRKRVLAIESVRGKRETDST